MAFDNLLPRFRMRVLPSLLPTQIELDSDGTDVRWRYVGGDWQSLVAIEDISASVAIGSVTTLAPGASATVVNVGTDQAVILDIGIPMGTPGTDGVDGAGAVDSVNGHTGVVVLTASDIGSSATGDVASTNVQAAIAELASEKAPKASPTFTGTVVVPDATFTPAKMQDGAARSVLGVAGNASATRADIQAANDGEVLRRSGTTVGFGTIVTAGLADAAVTLAKMANVATARFFGRTTAGTGVPEALTGTQATALLDAAVGDSGSGGTKGLVPAAAAGDGAAGKVYGAMGAFVAAWTTLLKAADETRTASSTLADGTLTFGMLANKTYRIRLRVFLNETNVSSGNFTYSLTGPASPTRIAHTTKTVIPGGSTEATTIGSAYPSVAMTAGSGVGQLGIDMLVQNGANAGTFAFNWGPGSGGPSDTAIVRGGSSLEYIQV